MSVSEKIYCAFCRLGRRVYTKKRITWTNVVLALLSSAILTFAFWQTWDPRGIFIFVLFLAMADIFIRIRWRMALPCPHCGFDPLLYKRNPDEAARRVKIRLDMVRRSDDFLFRSQNPLANLPAVRADDKFFARSPLGDNPAEKNQ